MMLIMKLPNAEIVISQSGGLNFFVFMVMNVPIIIPGIIAYVEILTSSKLHNDLLASG